MRSSAARRTACSCWHPAAASPRLPTRATSGRTASRSAPSTSPAAAARHRRRSRSSLRRIRTLPPALRPRPEGMPPARRTSSTRCATQRPAWATVEVLQSTNATTPAPVFTYGTTDPVVVRATKVASDLPSSVELRATDVNGNAVTCQLTFFAIGSAGAFPQNQKIGGPAAGAALRQLPERHRPRAERGLHRQGERRRLQARTAPPGPAGRHSTSPPR